MDKLKPCPFCGGKQKSVQPQQGHIRKITESIGATVRNVGLPASLFRILKMTEAAFSKQ